MINRYYNNFTKLGDVFERYAIYDFDQKLIDFLIVECANFLFSRNLKNDIIRHFTVEFDIKKDQSYVNIKGGNLISCLWLIDVYPPNPEKYIRENVCSFEGKNYIYDPQVKSLKIGKHGQNSRNKHRKSNY